MQMGVCNQNVKLAFDRRNISKSCHGCCMSLDVGSLPCCLVWSTWRPGILRSLIGNGKAGLSTFIKPLMIVFNQPGGSILAMKENF